MSISLTPPKLSALLAMIAIAASACGRGDTASTGTSGPDTTTITTPPTTTTVTPTTTPTTTTTTTTEVATTTTTTAPIEVWESNRIDFQAVSAAAVGDRLWLAGRDAENEFILASTVDGSTWERIDLEQLGLPTETALSSPGTIRGQMMLGSVDGTLYGIFAAPPQPDVSSQGAATDLWLVTAGADREVQLVSPETTGIDQRLAGPKSFRIMDLGDITGGSGRVHLFAIGQWWEPFATSDSDFAVVSLLGQPPWTTFSEDQPSGAFLAIAGAATLGDVTVAVGFRCGRQRRLLSFSSNDGVTWTHGGAEAPESGWVRVTDLTAGGGRFVALGTELPNADSPLTDEFPVAWWSEDGLERNRAELPAAPGGSLVLPDAVVWMGDRFITLAGSSFPNAIWSSTNGAQWTLDETEGTIAMPSTAVVIWRDRTVVVGLDRVTVSAPHG